MRPSAIRALLITVVLFLSQIHLFGQEALQRVTVLPFSASEGVSKADAQTLGRLFEAAIIKTQSFTVIEQASATRS
jgi:hypothetical protein